MTFTLDLPSDLENELSLQASQLKLPLQEYILRVLLFRPFLQDQPKTGTELVSYWENSGVINSRPDIINSQKYALRLRRETETLERT